MVKASRIIQSVPRGQEGQKRRLLAIMFQLFLGIRWSHALRAVTILLIV